MDDVMFVNVFASEPGGGSPTPIVADASGYDADRMLAVARRYGHECTFVLPPQDPTTADFRFRFFVPRQEMNMCGHATLGTIWLLRRMGRLRGTEARIETMSGLVRGVVRHAGTPAEYVEISQPPGTVQEIPDPAARETIGDVLGIRKADLLSMPVLNAVTSRRKTLVPLRSVEVLDALRPDFARMESLCSALNSTGLYPFAISDLSARRFDARQFPRASGFPEDIATGVAASALAFGLVAYDLISFGTERITVRQGRAMGRPSQILVRFDMPDQAAQPRGCFFGGQVVMGAEENVTREPHP
jgi:PhzF family phenazine biosynthesis protein